MTVSDGKCAMKESLKDRVYGKLLEKMICCELEPNSFITEDRLIEMAGTSRTPVREALHKLEEDRFIKIFPKRGIYICEITPRSLREVFEIRKLTEPFIIRTYGYRIPAEDVTGLINETEAMTGTGQDPSDTEERLLDLILNACSNEHLKDTAERMRRHSTRIRIGSGLSAADCSGEIRSKETELLQLILERRYEEASALRAEMLETEEANVLSAMMKAGKHEF